MQYETCAHCWNYSRLLCYHLSAILANPPTSSRLTITIFYSLSDFKTVEAFDYFCSLKWPENVVLRPRFLETERLMRRSIGRNLAAKDTSADWIHFADIDYLYGPGCLDATAAALATAKDILVYPKVTQGSKTHEDGDRLIEAVTGPGLYSFDPKDFSPQPNQCAIGGIQIVRGDIARQYGYLPKHRRFQASSPFWRRTFEDQAYRKMLGTRGKPIHVSNFFRIRHSKRGRTDVGVQL